MRHVFGSFKTEEEAVRALKQLSKDDGERRHFRVLTKKNIHKDRHPFGQFSYAPHLAFRMGLLGGVFGASVMAILSLTSFALPGIGAFDAQPGWAIGVGFIGGCAIGAMIGCLLGIPVIHSEARILSREIDRGHVLLGVGVKEDGHIDAMRTALLDLGALRTTVC